MSTTMTSTDTSDRRRWFGLVALCAAFFMVILDVAIVNVALPTIQTDLDFSQRNLQWVVSAYALTFGGLLLLGGRIADLVGRRRVFVTGVALFAARVAHRRAGDRAATADRRPGGAGRRGRAMTPAALSILMTTFAEGRSATPPSESGAPSAPRGAPSACCSAASSPTRSGGSGSSC